MVSTSKILTVSYGTFSCTLEGFDDSFDTMKAIAEYFRDLAADDRYFGAEPPTPDAEMLARIAEREIARRVEAHEDGGRIVLRAGTPAALPRDADRPVAAEAAERSAAPAARGTAEPEQATPPPRPVRTHTPEPAAEPAQSWSEAEIMPTVTTDPESVAAKLRRIRAVASPAFANYEDAVYSTPETGYAEDEHVQDFLGATIADLNAALTEDDADEVADLTADTDLSPAEPEAQAEVAAAEPEAEAEPEAQAEVIEPEAEPEAEAEAEVVEPEPEQEPEAAAADIADIMTPAGIRAEAEADATLESSDTDHAAPDGDAPEHAETGTAAEIATIPDAPRQVEDAAGTDDDDEMAAQAPEIMAEAPPEAASPEQEDDDILARLQAEEIDIFDFSDETDDALDDDDDDNLYGADDVSEDTLAQLMADALRDDDATPAPEAAAVQPEAAPLQARVVKMKRRDFEAAVAQGVLEDAAEDSTLSPEEEAELLMELAQVEAELAHARQDTASQAPDSTVTGTDAAFDDADEDVAEADDAPPTARRAPDMKAQMPDSQTGRIFDEADSQLEEPESNQRRNAIQHLRAAVAATRAEQSIGGTMRPDVDDQPYRLDLENAVRPRRPRPAGDVRSERPATAMSRPAPLKLVAEQRIDTPSAPIQPRRVSRADLIAAEPAPAPIPAGADSFSVFAEKMGAHSLPDLLEAAAAYISDIEGRQQFSRPMLMQKLREIDETGFSREEGLRSFGQLLRQGKLQKLRGGRFTVTDETEFRQAS